MKMQGREDTKTKSKGNERRREFVKQSIENIALNKAQQQNKDRETIP